MKVLLVRGANSIPHNEGSQKSTRQHVGCVQAGLAAGELPEAFEAEERSVAGVGELLHLVSGRHLLGCVREREAGFLRGELKGNSW